MLLCAATLSILDHPSCWGGIYAASEDLPPITNFHRRRRSRSRSCSRCVASSCDSQSFQHVAGAVRCPRLRPFPSQPPPPPMNVARLLNGNWMATYPGGPLRVVIGLDPDAPWPQLHRHSARRQQKYSAGPGRCGRVRVDPNVPGIVSRRSDLRREGIPAGAMGPCANHRQRRLAISAKNLSIPPHCHGFPVTFTRVGPAPTSPITD